MTTLSDALARAASAARARELDDVLRHLLDAWRARPSRAIGAVIDRAPSHAPPSDIAGKLKRSKAAWLELAATRDARALPALLQTLCDVSAPDAEARLELLRAFAPDPRLELAMLALLAEPPYTWYGSRRFFYAVIALAREARDERAPSRVVAAQKGLDRFSDKMRKPLARRLDEALAAIARRAAQPPAPLAAAELEHLAAVDAAFEAARGRAEHGVEAGDALLAEVFAHVDDDAPRAVYADWLQQRGYPHGELIALQLRDKLTREARGRITELLRDQRSALLGPLADVVKTARLRFERGFVSRCTIADSETRLVGSPWWRTVRELDGGASELVCHPVLRGLESLVVYEPCLGDIASVEPPDWQLVELRCHLSWIGYEASFEPPHWREDLRRLARSERLPRLRALAIRSDQFVIEADAYQPLFDGPLVSRLERLWLRCMTTSAFGGHVMPSRTIGGWIAALRRFRPATPLLELEDGYSACPTVYRFARDARDGRHRLVSVVTRFPRDEPLEEYAELLLAALQTLDPDDVAELDVSFALAKADKATRVAIEAAAARFPRVTHVSVT